jgi:Delta24-sterol reductase
MSTRSEIIEHARKTLAAWKDKGASPLAYAPTNTMRKKEKAYAHSLGLGGLKEVLSIDPAKQTAWVEPGVTMKKLVDRCLQQGLIPLIVPEFKGITVGGAINGAALESSSHLHGQFNDICLQYEVLLGDGRIVMASPEENRELFYGMASSYGTLGFLLKAEIKLQRTTGWMGLHYSCFEDLSEAVRFMKKAHLENEEVIEGIVFHPAKTMVMWGSQITESEARGLKKHSMSFPWSPWFYSHCDEVVKDHYEAISIRDYLFRHDRGAFWMAGYAPHAAILFAYMVHKAGLSHQPLQHAIPKNPGSLFRFLFGWMTGSQKLYKSLHGGSEKWFEEHFSIQDFYLPEENTREFTEYVMERYKIAPLWLCPIAPTKTPQLFSPHRQEGSSLLFDVGVYGLPYDSTGKAAVSDMERQAYGMKGKKMFYAYSYLAKEEFWSVYPEKEYRELREKCALQGVVPDITEKVLN